MIKKKQVLVVDDELDITLTLKRVLENGGFNIDLFNDPLLALQNFKTNFYDLIILDVKMPQMNGFDLYEKIKMIDNNVKVCFLTAWSDFRDYELGRKRAFSKEGEIHLIQKPIENEKLIEQINTIIQLNMCGYTEEMLNNATFFFKKLAPNMKQQEQKEIIAMQLSDIRFHHNLIK